LKEADAEERIAVQEKTEREEQKNSSEKYTQAVKLFSQGKKNVEVAILTGLRAEEVILVRKDYWKLIGADKLATLYDQTRPYLLSLLKLDKRMRIYDINHDDIVWALDHFKELRFLEDKIFQARVQLGKFDQDILKTRNELNSLAEKKSRLEDKVDDLEDMESEYTRRFQSYREFKAIERDLERGLNDKTSDTAGAIEMN
jgi:hypothetical protein